MKKKILCLLLLAAMAFVLLPASNAGAKAGVQDTTASDVRIMSANLYAEFPTWWGSFKPEDTSVRVVQLEKMLNENNPIAVCTQEMSPTWYTAFEQLDTTKWAWLTEPDAAGYSYYDLVPNVGLALNSILYRKDLLTLQGSGVEPYTQRTNGHCIVWGVFTINSTGKQFVLVSTHWTPDRPDDKSAERLAQAEQLAKKVNDLRLVYGDTVIVTGDFNCTDDSQEFRRFIANANAFDSRQWAAKRGDSLSKIDHIVATSDATINYHTVCYESNNAYKISDHPFIVADIKLTTNLYFDFTDTEYSRPHYKQGAYRYNAYDYHTSYWKHDSNRVTDLTINKSDGTLAFNVTETGNPYVFTDSKSATELKNAYGLNFPTAQAEHAWIRFRLTNSEMINTGATPSLTLSALNRATGQIKSETKTFSFSQANSGYVTVYFPLSSNGIRSLGSLDALQLSFENIKNGSVKIAYIYIGVNNYSPQNYAMMFDFSNTAGDQSRYKGSSYGGYQFDRASQGYWATWETSTTSNTVYTDFSIDNAEGTLSVKVAQGLAYNTTNGKYGPWITTAKNYGSYPWASSSDQHPLQYAPGNADFIQIRFKTEDCVLAAGSSPQIVVVYDYDTGNGTTARGEYTMVANYTLNNGTYQIVSIPVSEQFKAAKKITTLGFRFWHIKGTSDNAKVVIDSIYVGPEEAMPIHHVYDHKTVAPTCSAQGYTSHTCRTCGYSYKDTYTNKTEHSYKYDYEKIPTTAVTGSLKGTCTKCSATTTVAMPKLNTTDYTKTVVTAATCEQNGTDKYTWKVTTYGTFSINTNSSPLGHSYTTKVTAPTCTDQGYTTHTCSRCPNSYKDTYIDATGHSYTSKVTTAATCTKDGVKTYTCSKCSYSYTEDISATGHTAVTDKAVAATCTTDGKTEGSHCSVCNAVLVAQEVIPALGHNYSYTSNGDGTHNGDCTRCDSVIVEKHTFEGETCFCGAQIVTIDESIKIYHTLDLASDISISFVVQKSALANYDSYYMEFILPEYKGNELTGTSTLTVEPVDKGSYYYFTLTGITAVRMGDMVDATLHMTKGTQEYISMTDSYSVATYAYATLEKSTDVKMLTLCADLLCYGAEAQSYKMYRTDALVDAEMTDVHRSYLSSTDALNFTATDSFLGDLESPTITWVGKTLDLGSKVGLKFVFNTKNYSGNVENLSMKVSYAGSNGETKTVTLTGAEAYGSSGSYYSFTFYGLLASELRTIVDVAIFDGETQLSETIRYSAESYASKAMSGTLAPLCKALFAYSDSAKAYFAQ